MSSETDLFGEEIRLEKAKEKPPEPAAIVRKPDINIPHRPYRIFKETKLITWIMYDKHPQPSTAPTRA